MLLDKVKDRRYRVRGSRSRIAVDLPRDTRCLLSTGCYPVSDSVMYLRQASVGTAMYSHGDAACWCLGGIHLAVPLEGARDLDSEITELGAPATSGW